MAARREVAHESPDQDADQQDGAHGDVQPVQPSQAVKDCPIDARAYREALVDDEVGVFVRLRAEEGQSEDDREDEPSLELVAVISPNCVLSPVRSEAAG